jgi:circadian clock protein KaiC
MLTRRQEIERKQREIERRRAATRAQIAALEIDLEAAELEAGLIATQDEARERVLIEDRAAMAKRRGGRDKAGKATR